MLVPSCWVDGMAFGQAVLRGGENPWAKPEGLGLFHRELESLLNFDLIEISIDAAMDALLEKSPVDSVGDGVEAIEDFVSGSVLAGYVARGIEVVQGSVGARPIAVSLPGPGLIVRRFMGNASVDEDTLDDLSVALTGLIRAIYREGIGFMRITEIDPRALGFMEPLINVAEHYQCASVLVLREKAAGADVPEGFDAIFRDTDGQILPSAWWRNSNEVPQGKKLFVEVPNDIEPEVVLRRCADLKTAFI